MQFTFATQKPASSFSKKIKPDSSLELDAHTGIVIGLHEANDPSQIVPIHTCYLQHHSADVLLQAASQAVAQAPAQMHPGSRQQLTAFDPKTQQGFLRQLVLRRNSSNEYMVIISTSSWQHALLQPVVNALLDCGVSVHSIVNTVIPSQRTAKRTRKKGASGRTGQDMRQQSHVLHGLPTITEQLCGLQFEISPASFFQVNSDQAAVLYNLVLRAAGNFLFVAPQKLVLSHPPVAR